MRERPDRARAWSTRSPSTASTSPGTSRSPGFDDIPVARHLRPLLTTVRQPIQQLGATAFEALYSMMCDGEAAGRQTSCCPPP